VTGAIALLGGSLGALVGIVELTVGPTIRPWIGDKHDTARLGLVTIALSAIAIVSAVALIHRPEGSPTRRAVLGLGLLGPGLICFTTVGRLWYVPGALLVVTGAITVAGVARRDARAVLAAAGRNWAAVLTTTLGVVYLALGLTSHRGAGALGIVGGAVTIGLVTVGRRIPLPLALRILLLAVAPFALNTWWSLITPFIAMLIVTVGAFALASRDSPPSTTGAAAAGQRLPASLAADDGP
jgi:hypothetical protein